MKSMIVCLLLVGASLSIPAAASPLAGATYGNPLTAANIPSFGEAPRTAPLRVETAQSERSTRDGPDDRDRDRRRRRGGDRNDRRFGPPRIDDIAGDWQFARRRSNDTCAIQLQTDRVFGNPGYRAKGGHGLACSRLGLFHLRSWTLVGRRITLFDAFGKPIATVRFDGPGYMRGDDVIMQR